MVEDDALVAEAQNAMFSTFGYDVTTASSADEAMVLPRMPHEFQAMISDVQMAGKFNGIDPAEHLQATQPDLALMMLTGFVDKAERLRG